MRIAELEQKIEATLVANKLMTPAGFRRAVKEVVPEDIFQAWNQYLEGEQRKSWMGLSNAAKSMHSRADNIFHGNPERKIFAKNVANAIYGLIPLISGPRKRSRSDYSNPWGTLSFCPFCWRIVPGGAETFKHPVYCEHHAPQTKGYQKARRLKFDLSHKPPRPYKKGKKRQFPTRKEYTNTFSEVRARIQGKYSFEEAIQELPNVRKKYSDHLGDMTTLLKALLLDIPDPENKIAETIPSLVNDFMSSLGILLYAEAWLTLEANHRPGRPKKKNGGHSGDNDNEIA